MWKRAHSEGDEFCEQLPSAHNFAGAIIGDNWVAAFMVHLDLLGPVYTMRWRRETINVPKGVCPSLNDVKETLGICWQALGNNVKLEYSKFFLCVPGWLCRSVNAAAAIEPRGRWPGGQNCRARVEKRHVRHLEKTITTEKLPPDSVVVDFVRGSFILDDGRRMMDPVGAATKKLGLEAHLVVADGFWVNEILSSLGKMGVRVDGLTSTFGATADLLSDEDVLGDTLVVDIGARNTYVSFYSDGMLAATRTVEGGTDDVIARVAGDLRIPVTEVNASVAQLKMLLFSGDSDGECPLFVWRTKLPVVRDLDNAAVPFADNLLNGILREVEQLRGERGMSVRNAVVLGDDPLVVRSLLTLMKEKTNLRCRRGVPENVHNSEECDSPGYAHMVSMVRQHGSKHESRADNRTNALGTYGDSMANSVLQDIGSAIMSYAGKLKSREAGPRRKPVLQPSFRSSGVLLQTLEGSRYG